MTKPRLYPPLHLLPNSVVACTEFHTKLYKIVLNAHKFPGAQSDVFTLPLSSNQQSQTSWLFIYSHKWQRKAVHPDTEETGNSNFSDTFAWKITWINFLSINQLIIEALLDSQTLHFSVIQKTTCKKSPQIGQKGSVLDRGMEGERLVMNNYIPDLSCAVDQTKAGFGVWWSPITRGRHDERKVKEAAEPMTQ